LRDDAEIHGDMAGKRRKNFMFIDISQEHIHILQMDRAGGWPSITMCGGKKSGTIKGNKKVYLESNIKNTMLTVSGLI